MGPWMRAAALLGLILASWLDARAYVRAFCDGVERGGFVAPVGQPDADV